MLLPTHLHGPVEAFLAGRRTLVEAVGDMLAGAPESAPTMVAEFSRSLTAANSSKAYRTALAFNLKVAETDIDARKQFLETQVPSANEAYAVFMGKVESKDKQRLSLTDRYTVEVLLEAGQDNEEGDVSDLTIWRLIPGNLIAVEPQDQNKLPGASLSALPPKTIPVGERIVDLPATVIVEAAYDYMQSDPAFQLFERQYRKRHPGNRRLVDRPQPGSVLRATKLDRKAVTESLRKAGWREMQGQYLHPATQARVRLTEDGFQYDTRYCRTSAKPAAKAKPVITESIEADAIDTMSIAIGHLRAALNESVTEALPLDLDAFRAQGVAIGKDRMWLEENAHGRLVVALEREHAVRCVDELCAVQEVVDRMQADEQSLAYVCEGSFSDEAAKKFLVPRKSIIIDGQWWTIAKRDIAADSVVLRLSEYAIKDGVKAKPPKTVKFSAMLANIKKGVWGARIGETYYGAKQDLKARARQRARSGLRKAPGTPKVAA